MSNELHALESTPRGFAAAFNGEWIKKSCETCSYLGDEGDGYHSCPVCNWNDGENSIHYLPTWPFKNGCKHFDLHFTYAVDWEAEAKLMDKEHECCCHLSRGKCFCYSECEHKRPDGEDYPVCGKWAATSNTDAMLQARKEENRE